VIALTRKFPTALALPAAWEDPSRRQEKKEQNKKREKSELDHADGLTSRPCGTQLKKFKETVKESYIRGGDQNEPR